MSIAPLDVSSAECEQLAVTFDCRPAEVVDRLERYAEAAREEYLRMVLGQKVFTRGADIREYRLALLIRFVFNGRLPSESDICKIFQTTTSQSRALLRAVMSKYQYELQDAVQDTLREVVDEAAGSDEAGWTITLDSENIVDALNRELAAIDGTLTQITKSRSTVSTYFIPSPSYRRLRQRLADG